MVRQEFGITHRLISKISTALIWVVINMNEKNQKVLLVSCWNFQQKKQFITENVGILIPFLDF